MHPPHGYGQAVLWPAHPSRGSNAFLQPMNPPHGSSYAALRTMHPNAPSFVWLTFAPKERDNLVVWPA